MKQSLTPFIAATAGLSLVLLVAAMAGARETADCRATFEPARVAVQESPVTVHATLSDSMGEVEEVTVQDGSGLEVRSVQPTDGPTGAVIVFDTSGAGAGEWSVRIEGPSTDCEGVLAVTEGPLAGLSAG